jgi:hypothetical protein
MNPDGKSRDDLAREANRVRSQLMRTVERLDRRRHEALDASQRVQQYARQLVRLGGSVLLGAATACAVSFVVHRSSAHGRRLLRERRRRDRRRDRRALVKRFWTHPERAMRAQRRAWGGWASSLFGELFRSILVALVTYAVTARTQQGLRAAARLPGASERRRER